MTLLGILLGAGLVVGVTVASFVYLRCARRELPVFTRFVRALACGGGSFAGFLGPYVFQQELLYLYYEVLKPRPIVVSPYESLVVNLITGLVIAIIFVGLYLSGIQFRNLIAA